MPSASLELQLAQAQLQHFEEQLDPILRDHREAEDCRVCEQFLQHGIDAYKWLSRAEEAFLAAETEGVLEFTPELQQAIEALYHRWLAPCAAAEKWIARVEKSGYTVDNLAEFRNCCELVRDWIERNEHYKFGHAAAIEGFEQEE
jgi:hypothetical protein